MSPGVFDFLKGKKPTVTVTGINIKLQGYTHRLDGMDVKTNPFTIEIPYTNKTHTDMLTDAASFKAEKAEPVVIKSLSVAEPFKLVSAEPKFPVTVNADEKVVFKLTVQAPQHNYSGPISISLDSDTKEMVHIEISKTVIDAKGKKTPIETSSRILNIPKGQIFTDKIQLYKAFSFGDVVKSIVVSKPFEFVSSEPKLPLKIDNPNTYILNLYIQAPSTSYAGTLEVKID